MPRPSPMTIAQMNLEARQRSQGIKHETRRQVPVEPSMAVERRWGAIMHASDGIHRIR
jgi:hypothetical protein